MVRRIEELRATPDEVLMAEHDAHAENTYVGTDYYMQELDRRSRDRSTEASQALARRSHELAVRTFWLAVASAVLSLVAVVVAVVTLIVTA